jgi:AI-2E family transporter
MPYRLKRLAGSTTHRPWRLNREINDMPDTTPTLGPRWAQIVPAETPSLRGLTTLAVTVVIVAALYFGREVLVPITLAILLSFVLAPLVNLIRRTRIGRVPAVILSVLIALGVIVALGGIIGMQVAELADDIPRYQTTIRQKADAIRSFTTRRLSDLIGNVGREVQRATKNDDLHEAQGAPEAAPAMQDQGPVPLPSRFGNPLRHPSNLPNASSLQR